MTQLRRRVLAAMATDAVERKSADQPAQTASPSAEENSQVLFTRPQRELLLRTLILGLICLVSFSIRLFSVLRFESIIHEFDPWFNFRSTRYAPPSISAMLRIFCSQNF